MTPDGLESPVMPPTADPGAALPTDRRFALGSRLRRRQDYQAVYEHGTRLSGSLMTVFFLPNTLGRPRLGIAATRKIGSAVIRNRAKRRVRDLFRREQIREALDIVVIPRRELAEVPVTRLETEFRGILRRRSRTARA
jgi:ribonuclease P protein component